MSEEPADYYIVCGVGPKELESEGADANGLEITFKPTEPAKQERYVPDLEILKGYWEVLLTRTQRDNLAALLMDKEEAWAEDLLKQLSAEPRG
jgi:hypothetical protein